MSKQAEHMATSCLLLAGQKWLQDHPTPEDHHNLTPSPAFPLWQLTAVVDLDFWYSRCKPWFHLPAGMTGKSPQRSALKLVHFNRHKFSQILLQDFFIFFIKQNSAVYLNGAMPSSRKKNGARRRTENCEIILGHSKWWKEASESQLSLSCKQIRCYPLIDISKYLVLESPHGVFKSVRPSAQNLCFPHSTILCLLHHPALSKVEASLFKEFCHGG